VFVKLHCHGFFRSDQNATIGDLMCRFLEKLLNLSEQSGQFRVHFATAREAFNIVMAAVDGRSGEPGAYRDYQLRQIMQTGCKHPTRAGAAKAGVAEPMPV